MVDLLTGFAGFIADKRQVTAIKHSYANLLEKSASNDVSAEVMQKIANIVRDLTSGNYVGANAIQTVSRLGDCMLYFLMRCDFRIWSTLLGINTKSGSRDLKF